MRSLDNELEDQIIQILDEDTRVDPNEVNVRVENGVVHLQGMVDSAAERKAVREDVDAVPGISQVVDYLTLRNYIERSDDELKEAVRQDLMRDPYVDAGDINVEAHDGLVTLKGIVHTFAEKNAAENVAWWTPGVLEVVSHLRTEEVESPDMPEEGPVW